MYEGEKMHRKHKMKCDCGPQAMAWGPKGFKMEFGKHGFPNFGMQHAHQMRDNGNLVITVAAPGIMKNTIKIRAKPEKMTLKADRKSELADVFGKDEVNIVVDLEDDVVPDSANASYVDGVITVKFPLKDPGYEVSDISYE